MLKSRFKFICFLLAFSWIGNIFAASINFGSRNSAIKLGPLSSYVGELSVRGNDLNIYDGTLSIYHRVETPDFPVRADTASRSINLDQS
jgi:hypothetical protein